MMANRTLCDRLLTSEKLAKCSREADGYYYRLSLVADPWGRFEAQPMLLRSKAWPMREDITAADVDGFLKEWESADLIQLYQDQGKRYAFVVEWDDEQRDCARLRQQLSQFPDPPGWTCPRLRTASPARSNCIANGMRDGNPDPVDDALFQRYKTAFQGGSTRDFEKLLAYREDLGDKAIIVALEKAKEANAKWPNYALKTLDSMRTAGSLDAWRAAGKRGGSSAYDSYERENPNYKSGPGGWEDDEEDSPPLLAHFAEAQQKFYREEQLKREAQMKDRQR